MSPGQEFDKNVMLLTQTTHTDYEELCKLDVLGLRDAADQDQTVVFEEFKERLTRSPEGWYETILPWKPNHPYLPSNKENSLRRLQKLNRKLEGEGLTKDYDDIIKDQLAEGIIEKAPPVSQSNEFYIPHKSVIRKSAGTTEMRIVYDASSRATPDSPSLNDCLYPGPDEKYWIPKLRRLVTSVRSTCWGCKRFTAPPLTTFHPPDQCLVTVPLVEQHSKS
ncbi:uncharacterized protein LOC122954979 [Acropora millepora]|uniref:uncharacterized protein LOC122954979 n=1 Tax=Acropora millepora TaxID=45264 RepID=UPI001CF48D91|nr:uncharacterized protein LOC122954979 [Acropora millepora]